MQVLNPLKLGVMDKWTRKDWQLLVTNNNSYYNFPVSILEGFIRDTQGTLEKMLMWAAYDWIKKYSIDKKGKAKFSIQAMRDVQDMLGFRIPCDTDEYHFYKACAGIYSRYKGARTGISRRLYWELRDKGFIDDADKVVVLAFLAGKSILGKKDYCKTNDLLLFARMNGLDKPYKNEDELREKSHIVISAHFTRRRRDTIRRRLAEEFHLQSYSNRDRGYYISSKFTLEQLIEVVEVSRKSSSGTFKKKISDTRNRVLAKLAKKPP